jgi:hypothetical protein
MSDGLSDAYRMERQARAAEERGLADPDMSQSIDSAMEGLKNITSRYMRHRTDYTCVTDFEEKRRPGKRKELKEQLLHTRCSLQIQLEVVLELLKADKKL